MAKSRKQKTNVREKIQPRAKKRTATKKKTPEIDAVDNTVLTAFDALQSQAGSCTGKSEVKLESYADVSEERSSIISIVKGLEEQVETAFKLKEVLEAELDETQKKLSEELATSAQLDAEVKSLEVKAALVDQLREDVAFAEEERSKFAKLLSETQPQLEIVTVERDSLADEMISAEAYTKELEAEKMALDAQVINLKDKVAELEPLQDELAEVTQTRGALAEQVRDLTDYLKASDVSKNIFEKEVGSFRGEVKDLREKLTDTDSRAAELQVQLEQQRTENGELVETKARLGNEIKMLNVNYEAARKELNAFKKALQDIRSEATRTSGRVRQRYFKSKGRK